MKHIITFKHIASLALFLFCLFFLIGSVHAAGTQSPDTPTDIFPQVRVQDGGTLDLRATEFGAEIQSDTNTIYLRSRGTGGCPINCNNILLNPFSGSGDGNVGIGTENPVRKLHVVGSGIRVEDGGKTLDLQTGAAVDIQSSTNTIYLRSRGTGDCPYNCNNILLNPLGGDGNVGIGTENPIQKLHVVGGGIRMENGGKTLDLQTGAAVDIQSDTNTIYLHSRGTGACPDACNNVLINPFSNEGNVGIGTTTPQAKLDVIGTTRTQVLQITGGADLAEPFVIDAVNLQPGLVVAIDPQQPGQLRLATQAYERTVAGVISGAGGIQPGMIMQQGEGELAGAYPVALTGRVYVWADAAEGAIQPGDLLTTANTPGHAMKVTDYVRAQGAILGKAMSALETGQGLVLLLVSLQ